MVLFTGFEIKTSPILKYCIHSSSDSSTLSVLFDACAVTQLVSHQSIVLWRGAEIRLACRNVYPLASMACEQSRRFLAEDRNVWHSLASLCENYTKLSVFLWQACSHFTVGEILSTGANPYKAVPYVTVLPLLYAFGGFPCSQSSVCLVICSR